MSPLFSSLGPLQAQRTRTLAIFYPIQNSLLEHQLCVHITPSSWHQRAHHGLGDRLGLRGAVGVRTVLREGCSGDGTTWGGSGAPVHRFWDGTVRANFLREEILKQ